jgi:Rod binding domain-containing protein
MTDIRPPGLTGIAQPLNQTGAASRPAAADPGSNAAVKAGDLPLQKACAGMESLFLSHLLQKMRATIETSDLLGGGQTEKLYTSMLDAEIARNLATAGGIGLARMLQQQLTAAGSATPGRADEGGDSGMQQPVQPHRKAPIMSSEKRLK